MNEQKIDKTRRNLVVATCVAGGAAGVGAAVPLVGSMWPSERAKAAGAPVEADISRLKPGDLGIYEWRGKPVWVLRRTKEMLDSLNSVADKISDPNSEVPLQPSYAKNATRSIKPEFAVLVGICSHLGCSPTAKTEPKGDLGPEWLGGFYCPCHGSKFDLAGRVFKGAPAPVNLEVPPHTYLSDGTILIGLDKQGA